LHFDCILIQVFYQGARFSEQLKVTGLRIAVMTMVHREYSMFGRWLEHYGSLVGVENLYILSHGQDSEHFRMAPGANVIGVEKTKQQGFERFKNDLAASLQDFLLLQYDVVLKVDADEFVFFDHRRFSSLSEVLRANPAGCWFALAMDVFHEPGQDRVDFAKPVSKQRSLCRISVHMSKAVATKRSYRLKNHGAVRIFKHCRSPALPVGLYMAHLKYADWQVLKETSESRQTANHGKPPNDWIDAVRLDFKRLKSNVEKPQRQLSIGNMERISQHLEKGIGFHRPRFPDVLTLPPERHQYTFRIPEVLVGCF